MSTPTHHSSPTSSSPEYWENLILLASDVHVTNQQARASATSVLDSLRTDPGGDGGFRVSLTLLRHGSRRLEVTFFALTTLQKCLERMTTSSSDNAGGGGGGGAMLEQEKNAAKEVRDVIYSNVLGLGGRTNSGDDVGGRRETTTMDMEDTLLLPPYVRTKVGVVLALLVRWTYPTMWPNAFEDLLSSLRSPPPAAAAAIFGVVPGIGGDNMGGSNSSTARPDSRRRDWMVREDVLLRTLDAISDEIVYTHGEKNTRIKDSMRGYDNVGTTAATGPVVGSSSMVTTTTLASSVIPPERTVTGQIVQTTLELLTTYRTLYSQTTNNVNANDDRESYGQLSVLALSTFKRYISWIDLTLVTDHRVIYLLFSCLASSSPPSDDGSSATSQEEETIESRLAVQATQCLIELLSRGTESSRKVQLIVQIDLFRKLSATDVNLVTVDATHIDVVIKVGELINLVGLELLQLWDELVFLVPKNDTDDDDGIFEDETEGTPRTTMTSAATVGQLLHQCIDPFFFLCFSYDDIDVSGAVIPLASRLALTLGKELDWQKTGGEMMDNTRRGGDGGSSRTGAKSDASDVAAAAAAAAVGAIHPASSSQQVASLSFTVSNHIPRLLTTLYTQMQYPPDYQYDYQDEDEAEEEIYRTELRKLYVRLIRTIPELCLQFVMTALATLATPLSTSPTSTLECALRLVYHYCEGIRPLPGMKVVMQNDDFCRVLTALHSSDVTLHPHREVLILYYDLAVRYYPIFTSHPELLVRVLDAMSGRYGLQHDHPRVRSRSCYLLLKLVRAMGVGMRLYVETAVGGIQGLLSNPSAYPLQDDDRLYLFETIGLLLGRTSLPVPDQVRYLTSVMTPHVQSIEQTLSSPNLHRDSDYYGTSLSNSLGTIAYLSKGFTKVPPQEVQVILIESLNVAYAVLQSLPTNEAVRNKTMILLQRMILCLGKSILPSMPRFLELLIPNCTAEDVLDVSQLLIQLCSKFKDCAIPAVDSSVLPFLRQCHSLIPTESDIVGTTSGGGGGVSGVGQAGGDSSGSGVVVAAVDATVPPHLQTEQLTIRKMSISFLHGLVVHHVTPVLLTPTNVGGLEDILTFMNDGATTVQDASVKKYCIVFFRELINQWSGGVEGDGGGMGTTTSVVNTAVRDGFVRFVFEIFVPTMITSLLEPTFKERDAMQARNITEFGCTLCDLKMKRGREEFEQYVILRTLGGLLHCPVGLMDKFRGAESGKDMERCLKEMISSLKRR